MLKYAIPVPSNISLWGQIKEMGHSCNYKYTWPKYICDMVQDSQDGTFVGGGVG